MIEFILGFGTIASAYLLVDLFVLSHLRTLPVKIDAVTLEVKTTLGRNVDFYRASVTYVFSGKTHGYSVNGYA